MVLHYAIGIRNIYFVFKQQDLETIKIGILLFLYGRKGVYGSYTCNYYYYIFIFSIFKNLCFLFHQFVWSFYNLVGLTRSFVLDLTGF